MVFDKKRAFYVLRQMSFERIAGTEKELEAANILKGECEKVGIPVVIEDFEIDDPVIYEAKLSISKPLVYHFNCIGIGRSGNTPDEGISAPLAYVENAMDANLLDVKGKIVLLTGQEKDTVKKLAKAGALGYICIHGSLFDSPEMKKEIRTRNIRKKEEGDPDLPGLVIHISDAQELLRLNPEEVTIVLKQDGERKGVSHNVIATIEGTDLKDEVITFTAHYDSVIYSNGPWDNATGSITILELMHYFKANPPRRTLKFIWCGSEEIGLVGSRSWVEQHKDELDKVLLNINVDMTGVLLGFDIAVCSCEESISNYINTLGKIEGFPIKSKVDMYSSDSSSFAIAGVPAITFARIAPRGGAEIHSRRDVMDPLDPTKFMDTVEFMAKFATQVVNAKVFPVSKEMPKELKDKIEMWKNMAPKKKEQPKENEKDATK